MRQARLATAAALWLVACQTITEEMPQRTDPNPVAPPPIIVIPIPIPSPANPTPGPAPAPTPDAGPTPPPEAPPPSARSCGLPPMRDHGNCRKESPVFLNDVEKAIDQSVAEHPEYFNLKDKTCGNCYKVVNVKGYEAALVQNLGRRGLCAVAGEEVGVKNTNTFNEQYDLLLSSLYIRRGEGSYQVTCRPAAF